MRTVMLQVSVSQSINVTSVAIKFTEDSCQCHAFFSYAPLHAFGEGLKSGAAGVSGCMRAYLCCAVGSPVLWVWKIGSVDDVAATLDNLQYVIIGVVVTFSSGHDHGNTCMDGRKPCGGGLSTPHVRMLRGGEYATCVHVEEG
jgi:hypothetical protein